MYIIYFIYDTLFYIRYFILYTILYFIILIRRGATGARENNKFDMNSLLIQNCNIFEKMIVKM